jgi:hypothetical protein
LAGLGDRIGLLTTPRADASLRGGGAEGDGDAGGAIRFFRATGVLGTFAAAMGLAKPAFS